MTPREAVLIAKAHLAVEILTDRGKQSPLEFTDHEFAVLYLISEASQFAHGEKNADSPSSYEELVEKKHNLLLKNGIVTQRELDKLKPILQEYQDHETDDRFGFLHAVLNLISRISDDRAKDFLVKSCKESLRKRAQKNPSVVQTGVNPTWRGRGPDSDGDEFGDKRD